MKDLRLFLRQFASLCIQLWRHKPVVYRRHNTLSLYFDLLAVQSEMRRDAPHELVLPYTQTMMGFLLFRPEPRRIAMIGLGGGSLAKYCYTRLPDASILVAEINAEVIALREVFCIPQDDARFQVICADGADLVRGACARHDVLLVDGFDRHGASPQLCTRRFYEDCHRSLSAGGVLVVNLPTAGFAVLRSIARIRRSFEHVVVVKSEDRCNRIAFACKGGALNLSSERLRERLNWLEQRHRVGLRCTLERIRSAQSMRPMAIP